jgi:hypothetical protein
MLRDLNMIYENASYSSLGSANTSVSYSRGWNMVYENATALHIRKHIRQAHNIFWSQRQPAKTQERGDFDLPSISIYRQDYFV